MRPTTTAMENTAASMQLKCPWTTEAIQQAYCVQRACWKIHSKASLYGRSEVEEGMSVLVGLTDRVRTPEVVADQAESLRGLVSLGLVTPL